jgi:hypothetical protein
MKTAIEINQQIKDLEDKLSNVQGRETEVFTRVVGYYRPVANMHKGKRSEYSDRKEYTIDASLSDKKQVAPAEYILFISDTCPKCPPVKQAINHIALDGNIINASTPDGLNLARQYQVLATPTVLIQDISGNTIAKLNTVEQIHEYIGA